MEKRKPHYPLAAIQAQMVDAPSLRLTRSALHSIRSELRWNLIEVVHVVQSLRSGNFYKSMTTTANVRVWQDVYRATWKDVDLYLKFQQHEDAYYFTVSFKEL